MKKKELNTDNFYEFLSNEQLIYWENIYKFHLKLTTKDKIGDDYLTYDTLNKMHQTANENLKKINQKKLIRNI